MLWLSVKLWSRRVEKVWLRSGVGTPSLKGAIKAALIGIPRLALPTQGETETAGLPTVTEARSQTCPAVLVGVEKGKREFC
jgi:hypothetical protein